MPNLAFKVSLTPEKGAVESVQRAVKRYGETVTRRLQQLTVKKAERALELARFYAPIDTGFLLQHIHAFIATQGFSFEVGYLEQEFLSAGKAPYFLFQELGFHHWASGAFIQNAHLRPSFEIIAPEYEREVRQMLVDALRTASQAR